ncbi:hypothetical protein B0T14DRAFT_275046 [Immersiella caudata]|uniref:Fungal N-terminal domain-containing protein n=1 Tax=Immersiella caudata TaxID=314043 RepID=A0AA40BY04_9PEZI|nr:hypothetical protein B0T14DRAFT_275046 [Immersiella caudata]
MEVVGLTAAVLSIAKALQIIARVIDRLYQTAKDAPSVAAQMRYFGASLRASSQTVGLAIETLETCCLGHSGNPVIKHITKNDYFQGLAEESGLLMERVRDLLDELRGIKSWSKTWTSFKWTRLKPEMESLFAPMTSLKATLSLMADCINVAYLAALIRTPQLEREIKRLKNEIQEHMETIRQLREEVEYIPPMVRRNTNASERTIDSQVTLCHLAHSMVETETVPSSPPETFTFTKLKRKRHSRISSRTSTTSTPDHHRQLADSPVASPVRQSPVPGTTPAYFRSLAVKASSIDGATSQEPTQDAETTPPSPQPRGEPRRTAPSDPPKERDVTATTSTLAQSPAPKAEADPSNPSPEPGRRRISRTTPPESTHEQEHTDSHGTVIEGWIQTPLGNTMVEAYIDRRYKHNLISRQLQRKLSLRTEEYQGPPIRRFDGKNVRSLEIVTLRWRNNNVPCLFHVVEELERPLIFGRTFQDG